jgi:hypothetical protein
VNKSEEYRAQALICLGLAQDTAQPTARATLMEMARAWHSLAEQADRNSLTDRVYEARRTSADPQPVIQQQQQIQPNADPCDC